MEWDGTMVEALHRFGVAGLMGVLWVWERMYSRKREQQLTESHHELMQKKQEADILIELTRKNTIALIEMEQTQKRACELLDLLRQTLNDYHDEMA